MKTLGEQINYNITIDKWFEKTYKHVSDAITTHIGYCQDKTVLSPFDIFISKMTECVWSDFYKNTGRDCTEPDFTLYECNSDGGVDLTIMGRINVSVKQRSLIYNKDVYYNEDSIKYGKQYEDAESIITKLLDENKTCHFIVGAIRYQTSYYNEWMDAWDKKDLERLKTITKKIFNEEMFLFSTEFDLMFINLDSNER